MQQPPSDSHISTGNALGIAVPELHSAPVFYPAGTRLIWISGAGEIDTIDHSDHSDDDVNSDNTDSIVDSEGAAQSDEGDATAASDGDVNIDEELTNTEEVQLAVEPTREMAGMDVEDAHDDFAE